MNGFATFSKQRGIAIGALALAGILETQVVKAAPTGLTASVALADGFPAVAGRASLTVYQSTIKQFESDELPVEIYAGSIVDLGAIPLRYVTQDEGAR